MDNVTHALAGLLLAEGTHAARARQGAPSTAFRRVAAIAGVAAAELPDVDILYAGPALGMGKLGYLLHHRGHTHTVVAALVGALLVWGVALAASRAVRESAPDRRALLALCVLGTLSHVALDFTNNYGVHPFWPVRNGWHYGDAVFIVEPWLWVASLPALLFLARGAGARVAYALLLAIIVGAAWAVGMVGRGAATAVTLGALAWLAAHYAVRPARRAALAIGAWLVVEGTFGAASAAARTRVRDAVGPTYADAVLTPNVSDPTCVSALVVERDGPAYRVSTAAVAPWPALRPVGRCALRGARGLGPSSRAASAAVAWEETWTRPRAELAGLARDNCEVAAALRFMRVPQWTREGGEVHLWDVRYGRGGFASIVAAERPAACPSNVPPWTPPRADMLRD